MPEAFQIYDVFPMLFQAATIMIPLIILGVGGWWVFFKKKMFRKYPIRVEDFQTFGGNFRLIHRQARRIRKKTSKGIENRLEFRDGEIWAPPSYKDMILDQKGKATLYIETAVKGQHKILQLPLQSDKDHFEARNLDEDRFWVETELARDDLRWTRKDMLDRLYPIIAIVMVAVAGLILIYATFNYGVMPLLQRSEAYANMNHETLEQSNRLLDMSIKYMELARTGTTNFTYPVVPEAPVPTG